MTPEMRTVRRLAAEVLDGMGFRRVASEPASILALKAKLGQIKGVQDVYTTDTWHDGYFHLLVVVEAKAGKTPMGGWVEKTFPLRTEARGMSQKVFNLPDYPQIIRAVHTIVRQSGLSIDSIVGPEKVYEYQDSYARQTRAPRLGGYPSNKISVEVYAREGATPAA